LSAAVSERGQKGGALSCSRPYSFAELARHANLPTKTIRRWLLRAAENQPEVEGIVKLPGGGYLVPSVSKLHEYKGWEAFGKKFLSSEDNENLQARIRDQDRQIQALRARVGASERVAKAQERKVEWLVKLLERASGKKFSDEEPESGVVEVSEPLERASRTRTG
jgi:hypothetical protein